MLLTEKFCHSDNTFTFTILNLCLKEIEKFPLRDSNLLYVFHRV